MTDGNGEADSVIIIINIYSWGASPSGISTHHSPSAPPLGHCEDGVIIKEKSYDILDRKASYLKLTLSQVRDIKHLSSLRWLKCSKSVQQDAIPVLRVVPRCKYCLIDCGKQLYIMSYHLQTVNVFFMFHGYACMAPGMMKCSVTSLCQTASLEKKHI